MEIRKKGVSASGRGRHRIAKEGRGARGNRHLSSGREPRQGDLHQMGEHKDGGRGYRGVGRMAAGHAAVHRGFLAVVLTGGRLALLLLTGAVRTLLGDMAVQWAHACRAAGHPLRLKGSSPSGRPQQKHCQQTHTRRQFLSRSAGTLTFGHHL